MMVVSILSRRRQRQRQQQQQQQQRRRRQRQRQQRQQQPRTFEADIDLTTTHSRMHKDSAVRHVVAFNQHAGRHGGAPPHGWLLKTGGVVFAHPAQALGR